MKREKINIFYKIYLWWKFEGKYYHKDFIRGVKNLWRWFPTIWKDRDWDDHFIFELIRVKVQNQAKYIGDRDFHVSAKRDAEIMRTVAKLIKLQQDDFYGMEYMDYHDTKIDFMRQKNGLLWRTPNSQRILTTTSKSTHVNIKELCQEKSIDLTDLLKTRIKRLLLWKSLMKIMNVVEI